MNYFKLILSILLFTITMSGIGQTNEPAVNSSSYDFAIGLRGGWTNGLTLKKFTSNTSAIEGIISAWHRGVSVTGLYEKHVNSSDVRGLRWYYGGGGHVAIQADRSFYNYNGRYENRFDGDGRLGLGVDGIVGIEYKIRPIPFAISLDLKPMIEVNTDGGTWTALDPGIGIKLTF